ncbi:HNH endonuclease signature motif containing protein [Tsukamurella pseudospumae]|uniref:HNH endonuclease signature motif containing protein n=1 Tax=Tsukamurella pseudospumae TaxID=239498 RepID=UPI000837CA06|nr:HNH endonuclease signature motif containing protein [Tsukamurella pseudospumae]
MTTSTAAEYLAALASFENAAEQLAAASPVMLSSEEILDALPRLEKAARKVPHGQHLLAQVCVEQGIPGQLGYTGIKEMLADQLRLAGTEARDRMKGARSRAPRNVRGQAPEPRLPELSAAQREGLVSERHAAAVEQWIDKVAKAPEATPEKLALLEDVLVTAALSVRPEELAKIGQRAYELIDPDGAEPSPENIARKREVNLGKQGDDLMSDLDGALSPECRALMDVVFEKLARPGVNNPADEENPVDPADQDAVAEAAQRDTRSQGQRNHDALHTVLRDFVSSGALGQHRGVPCVPVITLGIDQLESEAGFATTATGGRMPVEDALRMMGTNPKYVLVLDLANRPLFLGREKRLATPDQRIALYGSEKGCTAPGCDVPATRCQVHHITEWADGGATDITMLTLACDKHHGKVTPSTSDYPGGWETITVPHGEHAGRTGWQRKADPTGAVRVNHAHHVDELYRQAIERWQRRRAQLRSLWRSEELRVQYEDFIGTVYDDIAAVLDGPHGPPLLEEMLAEHDAEVDWQSQSPEPPAAAA